MLNFLIERYFKTRPVLDVSICTVCAACKDACPTKAIDIFPLIPDVELRPKVGEPRNRPEFAYQKCSRCYRCRDLCPQKAILMYKPFLSGLLK